jgi:hypothetical protein
VAVVIFAWQVVKYVTAALSPLVPSTTSLLVGAVAVVVFAWQASNGITILIVANRVIVDLPVIALLPSLPSMAS